MSSACLDIKDGIRWTKGRLVFENGLIRNLVDPFLKHVSPEYQLRRKRIQGPDFYVDIFNPKEWKSFSDAQYRHLNEILSPERRSKCINIIIPLGLGSIERTMNQVHFLLVYFPWAEALRETMKFRPRNISITLGFANKDIPEDRCMEMIYKSPLPWSNQDVQTICRFMPRNQNRCVELLRPFIISSFDINFSFTKDIECIFQTYVEIIVALCSEQSNDKDLKQEAVELVNEGLIRVPTSFKWKKLLIKMMIIQPQAQSRHDYHYPLITDEEMLQMDDLDQVQPFSDVEDFIFPWQIDSKLLRNGVAWGLSQDKKKFCHGFLPVKFEWRVRKSKFLFGTSTKLTNREHVEGFRLLGIKHVLSLIEILSPEIIVDLEEAGIHCHLLDECIDGNVDQLAIDIHRNVILPCRSLKRNKNIVFIRPENEQENISALLLELIRLSKQ